MRVEDFIKIINVDFYTGVPDSQLKALCDYLMNTYGIDSHHHIIAANEGNATAIAAGYYLATGKIPVVYMQNSGEGNIINPLASLMNEKVYAIPCIFIVGWRGEPGVQDEPQHIFQGEVTEKLLDLMGVEYFIIGRETTVNDIVTVMSDFRKKLAQGHDIAFIIRKGALTYDTDTEYTGKYSITREKIICCITEVSGTDLIISTTGKASRELFEIRKANGQGHSTDFLTVGSMGHASSIALGVALNTNRRIWCIDGDGAALMHMGAMAVIGNIKPENLIHIIINNAAHETVGGMPTVAGNINLCAIAKSCGYQYVYSATELYTFKKVLENTKNMNKLCLIEVKCGLGSRDNLGRPTTTPIENKVRFMDTLNCKESV